jgi:hypothetical protein
VPIAYGDQRFDELAAVCRHASRGCTSLLTFASPCYTSSVDAASLG